MKKNLTSWLYPLVIACMSPVHAAPEAGSPNLVVIMTDDLGYADVGFNGCKDIPTPHIDSIAANGVRFTDGYVAFSVCSPSRAAFLTGRYPQRFGYERNPKWLPNSRTTGLALTETTLADTLGEMGYISGLIGKWHLGCHPDLHPMKRGFDEFYGHLGGGHRYFPDELILRHTREAKDEGDSYKLWILRGDTPVRTTRYLTDEFSDEALQFIDRHKAKPFFLFLAYNAPHSPMQATEEHLARFPNIQEPKRRTYAAMVSAVDDGVGRVLAKLREHKIENNTMVVFLSDNGGPTPDNASNNQPLRGVKGDPWEGGFRVPFAVQWPDRISKNLVYRKPVISLDIFATIAHATRAKTDPQRPLDGVNLLPYLNGENPAAPHEAIYLRMFDKGVYAVRSGDMKLVIDGKDPTPQLYNLSEDPGEKNNLAGKMKTELEAIDKMRMQWDSELIEPVFEALPWKGKNHR